MSTKTAKSPSAKASTGDKPSREEAAAKPETPPESGRSAQPLLGFLRKNGALIAAFLGIGAVGIIIGRASSTPSAVSPAPTAPTTRAGASAAPEPEPQVFDLTEVPGAKAGLPLRPMDRDIIEQVMSLKFDRARMNDLFPDRPYRVRLIGSIAERRIGLVMIDLDRDGKFDERWDLTRTEITRNVLHDASADGQTVKYTLAHGKWQVH